MALFLSTYENKVDKKGRVSVPSQFRTSLESESFAGIVTYMSVINDCIEACAMSRIERISDSIDNLDPLSEVRDAFAATILGASMQLSFDSEGRVILSHKWMQDAGIEDRAVFVGKGKTFEIWSPSNFETYLEKAKLVAINNRHILQLHKPS